MRISDWISDVCSSDLVDGKIVDGGIGAVRIIDARRGRRETRRRIRHIFDIGIVAAALAQGIARYAIILPPRNGRRIIVEEVVRHEFEARPAIPRSEEHTSELQ